MELKIFRRFLPGVLFALCVAAVLYIHFSLLMFQPETDDLFFSKALEHMGLGEYLWHRYQRWTGRIPIEAALVLITNHPNLWRLANSLMLLLLCYSAGRIGFGRQLNPRLSAALVFCLFMLMPASVLTEAAWWMTGSINYLWPAALACYGMLQAFDRRRRNSLHSASLVLASGLSVYNEQVALVSMCVLVPVHAWLISRGESTRWDKLHVAFMASNLVIAALAPGNANRYMAEQVTWFPNFSQLSFFEKFGNGLDLLVSGLMNPDNLLLLALALTTAALVAKRPSPIVGRLVLLAGLAYIGGAHVFGLLVPMPSVMAWMYSVKHISAENAAWPMVYVAMSMAVFSICCLVFAQMRALEDRPAPALIAGWALVAGLASTIAMGWSPTVHASGSRTQFVSAVVIVILTCRMGLELRKVYGSTAAAAGAVSVIGLAAWRIVELAP